MDRQEQTSNFIAVVQQRLFNPARPVHLIKPVMRWSEWVRLVLSRYLWTARRYRDAAMIFRHGPVSAGQAVRQNIKLALHTAPHLNFAIYPLRRVVHTRLIHTKSSGRSTAASAYNNIPSLLPTHSEPGKISAGFIQALSPTSRSAKARLATVGDLRRFPHPPKKPSALEVSESPAGQTSHVRRQKLTLYNPLERVFIGSKKAYPLKQDSYLEHQMSGIQLDGPIATSRYAVVNQVLRRNRRVEQQVLASVQRHFRKAPSSQEFRQPPPRKTTTPTEEFAERGKVSIPFRDNGPQQVPQINVDAVANQVMRQIDRRITSWRERTGKI